VVNPGRPARIEKDLLRQVNWEAFYFSEPHAVERFDDDPRAYCKVLTDPVSRQRFRPGTDSPTAEFAGRRWYFLTDSTHAAFTATPDSFLVTRLPMGGR